MLIAIILLLVFLFYYLPRHRKYQPPDHTSDVFYRAEPLLLGCAIVCFLISAIDPILPMGKLLGPHVWARFLHPLVNAVFWISMILWAGVHLFLKRKK